MSMYYTCVVLIYSKLRIGSNLQRFLPGGANVQRIMPNRANEQTRCVLDQMSKDFKIAY